MITQQSGIMKPVFYESPQLLLQYLYGIKTHGSESRGQEEAAYTHVFCLRDHYSELFTRMAALKF